MNVSPFPTSDPLPRAGIDRLGVAASVFCAIHCLFAPLVLLALPTLGGVWAHPASHWILAALVVPLAATTIFRGYRLHRRTWIGFAGAIGILLVLAGAAAPLFAAPEAAVACSDACCPSLATDSSGTTTLTLPPAAILSSLGGLALIACHVGNLCCCRACRSA